MHNVKLIGLFGFLGLFGLIAIVRPVPTHRNGGAVRLLGAAGLGGLVGFWKPWLGRCGALGSFSLWNHSSPALRCLAWIGLGGPVGLLTGLVLRIAG